MLVLSRKRDEALVFPALGIEVRVLEIRWDRVRIGIDAPENVRVLRDELLDDDVTEETDAGTDL